MTEAMRHSQNRSAVDALQGSRAGWLANGALVRPPPSKPHTPHPAVGSSQGSSWGDLDDKEDLVSSCDNKRQ
jgi:hypothetical protein